MNKHISSPRIISVSWGKVEIEGHQFFKDAILFPGGSREWDWTLTGTEHIPGIQPADVEELLKHGATEIILSRGFHECLQVCPETLKLLQNMGIRTHVLQTEKAVKLYNKLRKEKAVGGLFHSTC